MATEFGWMTLEQLKKAAILERVKAFQGNKTAAADSLGITRQTIHTILEEYEKEDQATKEKIEEVQKSIREIGDRMRPGYVLDPNTGMSVPVPQAPIGGDKVLLMQRPASTDPVAKIIAERDKAIKDQQKAAKKNAKVDLSSTIVDGPKAVAAKKDEKKKAEDLKAPAGNQTPMLAAASAEGQRPKPTAKAAGKAPATAKVRRAASH